MLCIKDCLSPITALYQTLLTLYEHGPNSLYSFFLLCNILLLVCRLIYLLAHSADII